MSKGVIIFLKRRCACDRAARGKKQGFGEEKGDRIDPRPATDKYRSSSLKSTSRSNENLTHLTTHGIGYAASPVAVGAHGFGLCHNLRALRSTCHLHATPSVGGIARRHESGTSSAASSISTANLAAYYRILGIHDLFDATPSAGIRLGTR